MQSKEISSLNRYNQTGDYTFSKSNHLRIPSLNKSLNSTYDKNQTITL